MPTHWTPFDNIRARGFFLDAILTFIAAVLSLVILGAIAPAAFKDETSPLRGTLIFLLLYGFFTLFAYRRLRRAEVSHHRVFGKLLAWHTLGFYSLWAFPLLLFSLSSYFLLYAPLSSVMPDFLIEPFRDGADMMMPSGDKHVLANLLNSFTVVLFAPIIEEVFFRGILLTRWAVKWNVSKGIIASSLIFALLHQNPISTFCVGCLMAILYIRTRSLFVPIGIHIANNSIPLIGSWIQILTGTSVLSETSTTFREFWWIGLLGFVLLSPFVRYVYKHYIVNTDWQVPYFIESEN